MSNSIQLSDFSGRSILAPTLFGVLDANVQARLLAQAPLRRFEDGQLVQQHGQFADGFWVIETGRVLVGQFLEEGEFRAVARLVAGDSYGELAVLANTPKVVDAIASGSATMRWIPASAYHAALAEDPANLARLAQSLALQLQEMIGATVHAGRGSVAHRLAALLINLQGTAAHQAINASQQQLGDLLGLTRATINKGLAELERAGTIERGYGKIVVRDREALRRFSRLP